MNEIRKQIACNEGYLKLIINALRHRTLKIKMGKSSAQVTQLRLTLDIKHWKVWNLRNMTEENRIIFLIDVCQAPFKK